MAVFCSYLISCFPGMLLSYCPSDFEMFPVTPVVTGYYSIAAAVVVVVIVVIIIIIIII